MSASKMLKSFTIFSFILIASLFQFKAFGQELPVEKPMYFFDHLGKPMMEKDFEKKIRSFGYTHSFRESDTAFVGRLQLIREKGQLSTTELKEIRAYVRRLTGKTVEKANTLVLHYFIAPTEDTSACDEKYLNQPTYIKTLEKRRTVEQFFISETGYLKQKEQVFQDRESFLRDHLFAHAQICGNYVIIQPDGSYYAKYGVFKQTSDLSRIDANWDNGQD
ncbi:hypothetical protein [Nonlabens xiamenensis]|uniref:hypothetical protein n=1 Tax=Nonlabens xiamenensis TaxID=2341043 RepID=UPI000F6093F3|nr:hypothetical protein [Nonlabens xiamenensis]